MRLFGRGIIWVASIFALTLISGISLSRNDTSGAYWLLTAVRRNIETYDVVLSTPDESFSRHIMTIQDAYRAEKIHWSADGTAILYWVQDSEPGYALRRFPLFDPNPQPQTVFDDIAYTSYQDISRAPNGQWAVFFVAFTQEAHLFRMPVGGGIPELMKIYYEPIILRDFTWSPDGNWLSYSAIGRIFETYVINFNSFENHWITNLAEPVFWHPDVDFFVANRRAQGRPEAIRVDLATFEKQPLTSALTDYRVVAWLASGAIIAQDANQQLFRIALDSQSVQPVGEGAYQVLNGYQATTHLVIQMVADSGVLPVYRLDVATGHKALIAELEGLAQVVASTPHQIVVASSDNNSLHYFNMTQNGDHWRRLSQVPGGQPTIDTNSELAAQHIISPDEQWLYVSYLEHPMADRLNLQRARINLTTGTTAELSTGHLIGFGPLVERRWHHAAGFIAGLLGFMLPLLPFMLRWRRQQTSQVT